MKREPVITGHAVGLKCDAPGCGWSDMTIKRRDYGAYRNAPCPKCGSNILTDADWNALMKIEAFIRFVNRWFWWLPRRRDGKAQLIEVGTDGNGKVSAHDKGLVDR